ncbi:helix-turn-helix transcriptional regulator [Neorhizobium galegae]|uniref:ATP-binding protein n=1 Tax=Neorhizobium galegae TaxID=399 RepID=UPI0021034BA6|nr:winged helix-turn-helix domain-containing protein [Neorhizobium galegae]MCQ1775837.1 helix-turn-helix transcriptional regulator [Neorhizobium galegae]MCQ1797988.1 helix-turn-helix transcriptional regulator [Neorhizobium galegae]
MQEQAFQTASAVTDVATKFGSFLLYPERHLLLRDDEPVTIGSRALDILITLTERAGEVVTKDELISRAWPNTTVEESNLRAQIALLRKVLGDDHAASRYIAAVPSRGYRFIAALSRFEVENDASATAAPNNLPRPLSKTIGRDEAIKVVEGRFQRFRLVTLVGPGGMGKTTVGLSVAEKISSSYRHGVCFLDLAPIANPQVVPSVLASQLRLPETSGDPIAALITHLREKRMLLVFDSCELVLDATALLAETLLREAPTIDILATSREALRVEGESVYRLPPLDMPPPAAGLTAADALGFAAIRLFVERATSFGSEYTFDDDEAPLVTHICRQLDGIALAIELAAGRVEAFGTRGIAELLNDRLRLLTGGRRTALPRHQTLSATIAWSYEALSEPEQTVLRRLAVFAGDFGRDAVTTVAADLTAPENNVSNHLANLVAKSLVQVDARGKVARYRLLDTTRAYLLDRLRQGGEFEAVMRRLAQYLLEVLKHSHEEVETMPSGEWLLRYGSHINNVRTVLDWAYSDRGDTETGMAITVAAIPLWYQLSLVDECLTSVQRALLSIHPGERREEQARKIMHLYRALGLSQAFKVGFAPQAPATFSKALEIAQELGDVEAQAEALWGLWFSLIGLGEYRASLMQAERFIALAGNSLDHFIGDRMLSMTLFCMGDFRGARHHADLMLARQVSIAEIASTSSVRFLFGQSVSARIQPAQLLWMQGFPDQAMRAVETAVDAARSSGHAISICEALARWSCPVLVHIGDLAAADAAITELLDLAAANSLGPWEVFGRCWKAALLINQGVSDRGVPLLRKALAELRQNKLFTLYNVRFLGILTQGLASVGQLAEARALVEAAIDNSEKMEELWCVAELYRIKGEVLWQGNAGFSEIEECFVHSTEISRQQDALSWELKTTMSFARLLRDHGDTIRARQSLKAVYQRFTEGFATADMIAAKALLTELS